MDAFRDAVQSLKRYRRADIEDERGESLIEELYVDPLPNEHVLRTLAKENTTFIIGRKGTGKSTVFLRALHELRRKETALAVYIDIKTVHDSAQVDPKLVSRLQEERDALPEESLEKLLLMRAPS